ncbi:uncharacterized protein DFE_2575 [Desulfovibrio ferrophilus]|uniref:Uncharacterized protein n=1 Tax=Desulfovibrio ferrophilus TaxID=241368 RepID=A0A2Z6B1E9_9BACT|nr:uncharacterized protein DFE_2575 [Desulfovibrio ferrophilus]
MHKLFDPEGLEQTQKLVEVSFVAVILCGARADQVDGLAHSLEHGNGTEERLVVLVHPELVAADQKVFREAEVLADIVRVALEPALFGDGGEMQDGARSLRIREKTAEVILGRLAAEDNIPGSFRNHAVHNIPFFQLCLGAELR